MNENTPVLPRRTAVAGTVAVCGLASACARYGGPTSPAEADTGDGGGGEPAPTGEVLGLAKDIPLGSGVIFKDKKIVVTQPSEGTYKAFSAVCTHQGCLVNEVTNGTINCDCHASRFAIADGSVSGGPAPTPLPAQQVTVTADGKIMTGQAPAGETTAETTEVEPPPEEQTTDVAEPAPRGLASTGDIPVGGGKVFAGEEVVITQPTKGEFRCFSAVCTHQGCLVNAVKGGTINCDCHGSKFAVADGSVTAGPAPTPLPERSVRITGDQISLTS